MPNGQPSPTPEETAAHEARLDTTYRAFAGRIAALAIYARALPRSGPLGPMRAYAATQLERILPGWETDDVDAMTSALMIDREKLLAAARRVRAGRSLVERWWSGAARGEREEGTLRDLWEGLLAAAGDVVEAAGRAVGRGLRGLGEEMGWGTILLIALGVLVITRK